MKKTILVVSLCLILLFCLAPTARADSSYECGDNLTWSFDASTGKLTIYGYGPMYDYACVTEATQHPWYSVREQITSISLPTGLTYISDHAFEDSSITSITIPGSVLKIGAWSVAGCEELTTVIIRDGVTDIDTRAFSFCPNLSSLTLGSSVATIGYCAFGNCPSLTSVTLPSSVTSIDVGAFAGTGLKSIIIPSSITRIEGGVFNDCQSLASVTIPNSVTSIGDYAFCDCPSLKSITLPSSVTSIEEAAFEGCTGLTSVTIPNSVTALGEGAFKDCTGLTSVTLPCSVTDVYAFYGCTAIDNVRVTKGSGSKIVKGNGPWSCSGSASISVTVDDGVTGIDEEAFRRSTSFVSISSVSLPSTITSIGDRAFYGNANLTSFTIPSGTTTLGQTVFGGCDNLTSIQVAQDNQSFQSVGGVVLSKDSKKLVMYPAGKQGGYSIPSGVTSIGKAAFSECLVTSVTIPDGVASIEESAFASCDGLKSVTLPSSVTSLGKEAFFYCGSLASITIPSSVTSIGESAFFACYNLSNVYYQGIRSQQEKISIASSNDPLFNATWHYLPVITAQPTSVTANEDKTASFSVTATDAENYQWQWSSNGGKTWANSTEATTGFNEETLQVVATSARNGYKYRCVMSNGPAGTIISNVVTLTVISKPTITTQPKSVTAAVNTTAKFTVAASGTGLKYQWQWSADNGKTWTNSSSATLGYNTDTLQVTATTGRNGYQYRCQVSNSAGTVTSNVATLTVTTVAKPTITTQPKSVTAAVNTTAKFTVAASGTGLKYQWQWSADSGKTWANSSSATTGYNTATLQVSATTARNGYRYRCQVSNVGGTVTSSAATLTVTTEAKPTITTQPKSVTAAVNTTAKFTVAASGSNLKYQWQWSADSGKTWNNSSSATTGYNAATLQVTATAARNGYKYRCKVSNAAGTVTSNAVTLTVDLRPTITTQPSNKTVSAGSTATFKVVASNATGYQWQWSADNGATWSNSSSATTGYNTATLQVTATAARNGYKYRCKVSNSAGTVTSSAATLTVDLRPTITTQPTDKTVTAGSTATFKVVASNATGYQWQWSADNGATWKDSGSATTGYNTATLQVTATAARNGYKYRCKVSNSAGTVTTSAAKLTVN